MYFLKLEKSNYTLKGTFWSGDMEALLGIYVFLQELLDKEQSGPHKCLIIVVSFLHDPICLF